MVMRDQLFFRSRLREFQAIAPGIGGIKAAEIADGVVPHASNAGLLQGVEYRVDIGNGKRWVCFGGRPEIFFDADM